jgi:hypothetical protein
MKLSSFAMVLSLHAGLCLAASADSVTLNDGTVIKGKITRETADFIIIEKVEKGITDEIRVKRTNITKIVKDPAPAPAPPKPKAV